MQSNQTTITLTESNRRDLKYILNYIVKNLSFFEDMEGYCYDHDNPNCYQLYFDNDQMKDIKKLLEKLN